MERSLFRGFFTSVTRDDLWMTLFWWYTARIVSTVLVCNNAPLSKPVSRKTKGAYPSSPVQYKILILATLDSSFVTALLFCVQLPLFRFSFCLAVQINSTFRKYFIFVQLWLINFCRVLRTLCNIKSKFEIVSISAILRRKLRNGWSLSSFDLLIIKGVTKKKL